MQDRTEAKQGGRAGQAQRAAGGGCLKCASRPVCFVGSLTDEETQAIVPLVKEAFFRRGHRFIEQDDMHSQLQIIKVGTVIGMRRGPDGQFRPTGPAGRGALMGIQPLWGVKANFTVIAPSFGRYCTIDGAALKRLPIWESKLRDALIRQSMVSSRAAYDWCTAVLLPHVVDRLAYALVLLQDAQGGSTVEIPPQALLASILSTTRESIARGLGLLAEDGRIKKVSARQWMLDREKLVQSLPRSEIGELLSTRSEQ